MSAHAAEWRGLFPTLASADAQSQAMLDGALLVSLPSDQAVIYASSPCANYVLLLEGGVRVQVIGEGGAALSGASRAVLRPHHLLHPLG